MARTNSNKPEIEIPDPEQVIRDKYDQILSLVIIVLGVGFITILITVIGLVIDAWNTKTLYAKDDAAAQQLVATQQAEILDALKSLQAPTTPIKH